MKDEETKTQEPDKQVSIVDEAKQIRDEIVKARDSLREENQKKEKLQANELLGSSAGGRVEIPKASEEEIKKQKAVDFFKGTSIEEALTKHDE